MFFAVFMLLLRAVVVADEPPPDLVKALKRNVGALSPITVNWTEQLGSPLALEDWLRKVKYESYNADTFTPTDVTFAWQDGMSYVYEMQEKADITSAIVVGDDGQPRGRADVRLSDLPRAPMDYEAACNLARVFRGQGRETYGRQGGAATLAIDNIDEPKYFDDPRTTFFDSRYLYEAGFVLPRTLRELRDGAASLPLHLMNKSARFKAADKASVDGSACVVLELEENGARKKFFFDPLRAHALLRREELTQSGRIAVVSEMSDFVRFTDPEIWLPRRCLVTYYTWPSIRDVITDEPLATVTINVKDVSKQNIPLSRFSLRYTVPGTHVADATMPQAKDVPGGVVRYDIPASAADLDAAIQSALDRRPFVPGALRGGSHWLLIANMAVVVLVLVALAWRHARRTMK